MDEFFTENNHAIVKLDEGQFNGLTDLFSECFENDPYFVKMFPKALTRKEQITAAFKNTLFFLLSNNCAYGVCNNEKLIAFFLMFNYHEIKSLHADQFEAIFRRNPREKELPYKKEIHEKISCLGTGVVYLLSIGVSKDFRRKGIAKRFIDFAIENYPNDYLAGDVSNASSMGIYEERNFDCNKIDDNYFLVIRKPEYNLSYLYFTKDEKIHVVMPDESYSKEFNFSGAQIAYQEEIKGYRIETSGGPHGHFVKSPACACAAFVCQLAYTQLLMYQRHINLSCYQEEYIRLNNNVMGLIYHCVGEKTGHKLWNNKLKEMVLTREKEWAVIPDIQVLLPVEYLSAEKIKDNSKFYDSQICAFLFYLENYMYTEAGIPRNNENKNNFSFENRIERYYLGKKTFIVNEGGTVETYGYIGEMIGAPAEMDIVVSIDRNSNCGVFSIITESTPFLLSHLLDNIIRNQLFVGDDDGNFVNIISYISEKYGIIKRGTPKSIVTVPQNKDCLPNSHIASLLMSETIFASDEDLGLLIDEEVVNITESATGMGLYDRAFVCVYTNTFIQFCNNLYTSVKARLSEESIVFFYVELLALEEASIQIIDRNIIECLSQTKNITPIKFLKKTLNIHKQYARTIEFWDIKLNYPSSKKSISMIRKAFKIDDLIRGLKRDAKELQIIFEAQKDIMDRTEAAILNYIIFFLTIIQGFSFIIQKFFPEMDKDPVSLSGSLFIMLLILFIYYIIRRGVGKR